MTSTVPEGKFLMGFLSKPIHNWRYNVTSTREGILKGVLFKRCPCYPNFMTKSHSRPKIWRFAGIMFLQENVTSIWGGMLKKLYKKHISCSHWPDLPDLHDSMTTTSPATKTENPMNVSPKTTVVVQCWWPVGHP